VEEVWPSRRRRFQSQRSRGPSRFPTEPRALSWHLLNLQWRPCHSQRWPPSGTMTGGSSQDGSRVFITRTNTGLPLQQLAINLSTSGGNNQFQQQQQQTQQQQQSATTNNSKVRPSMNVVTHLNLPKINLPTQPARLLNYPGQQHQFMMSGPGGDISHHLMEQQQQQQQQRLPTNSPRPSILRRREGERELILAGKVYRIIGRSRKLFVILKVDTHIRCSPSLLTRRQFHHIIWPAFAPLDLWGFAKSLKVGHVQFISRVRQNFLVEENLILLQILCWWNWPQM